MLKILFDHHIPYIEELFSKYFELTSYQHIDELKVMVHQHDILICRSHTVITDEMIQNTSIQCIATASSGSEHIHIQNPDITVIDARGGNAHAVGDYILCILAEQNIESNLSVGIIGYGYVGQLLSKRLKTLGFKVKVYDPLKNLTTSFAEILNSQIILVHPNYHCNPPYPTHHLLSDDFFNTISNETILINASRGKILDEAALLKSQWKGIFCTDVYQNEPHINPKIIERATICTPHIAGHSLEAKRNISEIIAQKIHEHFKLNYQSHNTKNQLILPQNNWQTEALKIYSPRIESQALKSNCSAEHFLRLRKAHHRPEFEIDLAL
jgi:erythronate-4-phosphate dehydrogenase